VRDLRAQFAALAVRATATPDRARAAHGKFSQRIAKAMPRGGAKPGERRGGRKKGTPNRRTVEARLLAERLQSVTPDAIEGATPKLGKELLEKWMTVFDRWPSSIVGMMKPSSRNMRRSRSNARACSRRTSRRRSARS
jgi:hypothetical protein